jgi:hypothetical protein
MKRIILTAAAAAAVLTGSVVAAAPAFASTGPQQFVTHEPGHPDTTVGGLPGSACGTSANGPTWAADDLSVKLIPVAIPAQANGANYRVDIAITGSFAGFADPNTCYALTSSGPVKGSISYDVAATQAPDGAGLLPQQAGGDHAPHLSDLISQLFDGNAHVVGGGDQYTFSYQNGGYVQNGAPTNAITGQIRGH